MDKLQVYDKGIIRNWREMRTLRMVFQSPLSPAEAAALLEQVRSSLDLPAGPKVGPGGVALSPKGPVLTIHGVTTAEEADRILDDLGEALAGAGGSGSIRAVPQQRTPVDNPDVRMVGLTAGFCIEGHTDPQEPMDWINAPETMEAIIEKALQWFVMPGGTYYVSSGWSHVRCTLEQCRDLLITGMGIGIHSARIVCATDDGRIRSVAFGFTGTVFFARLDPEDVWEPAVNDLTEVLASLSGQIQYGAIKRTALGTLRWDWFTDYEWPARQYLMRGKSEAGRSIVETYVPEAFGVQLLGPRHSLPDSTQWLRQPVDSGRVLLIHRDLPAWFSGPLPDETTLARARDDLAPMLLTNEVADEAWKQRWAGAPTPQWPPRV